MALQPQSGFSELGANVLLTGRRRVEGERLVREMNRNRGKVVFFPADLSDAREVKTVVPAVLDAFGRLDFAFNNAGISGAKGSIVEQSEREYDLAFDINVKAMFLLLQDELRQMVAQGFGGSIVNTSSVGGTLQPLARRRMSLANMLFSALPSREQSNTDTAFASTLSAREQ